MACSHSLDLGSSISSSENPVITQGNPLYSLLKHHVSHFYSTCYGFIYLFLEENKTVNQQVPNI